MLREAALDTKRRELRNCVGARKRKLSELYNVAATVAANTGRTSPPGTTCSPSAEAQPLDEARFQDENDIQQGKRFHLAILGRIPGSDRYLRRFGSGARYLQKQTISGDSGDGKLSRQQTPIARDGHTPSNELSLEVGTRLERSKKIVDKKDAQTQSPLQQISPAAKADDKKNLEEILVPSASSDAERSRNSDEKATSRTGMSTPPPTSDKINDVSSNETSNTERNTDGRLVGASSESKSEIESKKEPFPDLEDQAKLGVQPATPASAYIQDQFQDAEDGGLDSDSRLNSLDIGLNGQPADAGGESPGSQAQNGGVTRGGTIAARRQTSEQRQNGLTSQEAGDAVLGQKPPMRIDTGVARNRSSAEFSASLTSLTPLRSAQAAMQSSPPERMTTRVSSGALRHKSVSEILGETPKSASGQSSTAQFQDSPRDEHGQSFRRGSLVASPDTLATQARLGETKDRDKERSKLSAVVFARQKGPESQRHGEAHTSHQKQKSEEEKDYLVPLFAAQAAAQTPTLNHLISTAHKTLSTTNHYIDYHESQDCRILKRIYHLQNSNRWSLRQLERSAEPARPTVVWDALLGEVKWMRTDFREERKWKMTTARVLASWCAEWVSLPKQLRASLQVKVRAKPATSLEITTTLHPPPDTVDSEKTPDLVDSMETESSEHSEEELRADMIETPPPAALFSLGPDHVTFAMDKTPVSEKLLSELPQYQPFPGLHSSLQGLSDSMESVWRKSVTPVSKFAISKFVTREEGPKRKKSRYDYTPDDEGEEDSSQSLSSKVSKALPPEQDDVALFSPENSHIVERLHASHAFRPPSQHVMPSQHFFESRSPSQWTLAEDDELRRLVREYEYNWHLISEALITKSLFISGAERRTPWECFERWESFEGLPGDMDKHSYFRAWRTRRQNAKHQLEQRYLLQQQAAAGAQLLRRRSAEPMHVDKRRNDKHYAIFSGMAKVMKRRETLYQKQQHAAQMSAYRKQPESSHPALRMQTPQEFSAHKHKQEMEFKEKQLLYRQQMEQARKTQLEQQRAAQQLGRQQGGLAVAPQNRMSLGPMGSATQRPGASLGQSALQNGGRSFSHNMPNGSMSNGSAVGINRSAAMMNASGIGVPQAQMHPYMQGQHGSLPGQPGQDASRVMTEAMRVQEQQRLMQRQVRNQPNGSQQPNQPGAMMGNVQYSAKLSSANGVAGSQQRLSSSPSMPNAHVQQLSSGMVPLLQQITHQLKAHHPHATNEQIKQMATQNLNQHLRQQNAQASSSMNGNGTNGNVQIQQQQQQQGMNYNSNPMSPQMYAQYLRTHQANQQNRHALGSNTTNMANGGDSARPDSRGTPGSQSRASVATNGASSSPRPPQAQMAGSPS